MISFNWILKIVDAEKGFKKLKDKKGSSETFKTACPLLPPNLNRKVYVNTTRSTISEIEVYLNYLRIKNGGENSPRTCTPRTRVAIIVPYRNREDILVYFLRHIHPFLTHQQIVIYYLVIGDFISLKYKFLSIFNRSMVYL